MMGRKDSIVKKLTTGIQYLFKKNKITHISGLATFTDKNSISVKTSKEEISLSGKNFIIATGSTSIDIPSITVDEKQIVTSTGALALNKVPQIVGYRVS